MVDTNRGLGLGAIPASSSGAPPTGAAGGGLGGTYPNPTVTLTATRVGYGDVSNALTGDSGFTRTSLALTLDSGLDGTYTFGNFKVGVPSGGTTGRSYLATTAFYTTTDYALQQTASGVTVLNSKSGGSVQIAIAGSTKATLAAASLTLNSGVTYIGSDTTNSTTAATGAITTLGGIAGAKNFIAGFGVHEGVTSTATAAGTTTLTATSTGTQIFTGSTTQTVQLPAASLFGAGISVAYTLINRSSGSVSWARAGSDTINGATSTVAVTTNTVGMIFSDGVSAWYTK